MNRTPISELKLQASPNLKRALAREAPRSHRVSMPHVPEHLNDGEKEHFEQACAVLTEKGILDASDRLLLERYSIMKARWAESNTALKAEGDVIQVETLDRLGRAVRNVIANPRLNQILAMERSLLAMEKTLQLTPSRREPDNGQHEMSNEEAFKILDDITGKNRVSNVQ